MLPELNNNNKSIHPDDDFELNFDNMLIDYKMSDVFEGSFTNKIECSECKYSTEVPQKFQDINLVSLSQHIIMFKPILLYFYLIG